jgi:hypothetical protein
VLLPVVLPVPEVATAFPAEPVLLVFPVHSVQEAALASLVPLVPKVQAALWLPVRERVPELALVVPRLRVASALHLASL